MRTRPTELLYLCTALALVVVMIVGTDGRLTADDVLPRDNYGFAYDPETGDQVGLWTPVYVPLGTPNLWIPSQKDCRCEKWTMLMENWYEHTLSLTGPRAASFDGRWGEFTRGDVDRDGEFDLQDVARLLRLRP